MGFGHTFRSLIHFEFNFVYGVRKCSSFILLQVVDQFSQHHLLKRLSLSFIFYLRDQIRKEGRFLNLKFRNPKVESLISHRSLYF